jgi:Protein of unknown function (DUF1501)
MNQLSPRRHFLTQPGISLGSMALTSLLSASEQSHVAVSSALTLPVRAKRIIYLFMHGGPSQLDLFDHKPDLRQRHGEELPASVRGDQRLTGMTSGQKSWRFRCMGK